MSSDGDPPAFLEGTAVVLDTTVLSNFARTDSVDWLADTLSLPVTVHAVRQEVEQGREEGYEYLDSVLARFELVEAAEETSNGMIGVVPLGGLPRNDAPESMEKLDRGEAHALYGAWPEGTLATDDLDARRLARKRSVYITGSIGILAYGVLVDELSLATADGWLEIWEDAGFYSPVESVSELVSQD